MSSFDKLYKEAAGVDDQAPAAPKPMTGTPPNGYRPRH